MLVVFATVEVSPDKVEAYEAAFRRLAVKARTTEPGLILYEIARSPEAPHTYHVFEVYKDAVAKAVHIENEATKAGKLETYACLVSAPVIRQYETVP